MITAPVEISASFAFDPKKIMRDARSRVVKRPKRLRKKMAKSNGVWGRRRSKKAMTRAWKRFWPDFSRMLERYKACSQPSS